MKNNGSKFIMYLFFIILLFSCKSFTVNSRIKNQNNSNKFEIITQRLYYRNLTLKVEQTKKIVNGDTFLDGNYRLFYPSGGVKLDLQYQNGQKQGQEMGYFENRMLEHIGWYKSDKNDSFWVWYYNDPLAMDEPIQAFNYWKNGIQLWHQMEYYPNKRIKEYLYYDPIGRPIFRREYDDTGNFIDEGKMVPQLVMVNEKSSIFNREDTLVVRICHVDPPNTSNTVKIRILGLVDNWETIEPIDEFFPKVYKTVLNKKGVYTLEVKFQIKEDKNPEFREFTNNVEFTVE